jgi:hypothetical protein
MKKHIRIYLEFFGYGIDDFIPCEVKGCNKRAVDIHHIDRRGMGGSKEKDYIENLVGLCRKHHDLAESDSVFNKKVKEWHLKRVEFKKMYYE